MSKLFTPAKIGNLTLPNRIVRSATAERMADDQGRPLPSMHELYRQLVEGGVGLIITGHLYIHPSGKAHPEMAAIDRDDLIPGLAALVKTVHDQGGKIAAQINHAGMYADDEAIIETIAPSLIGEPLAERPARQITLDEIETMIDAFAQAARRAKQAGFDAVQIHAAHGYLSSQFLSPRTNHRTDEWGGKEIEERMRFLKAVIQAVRQQVGPDYPVFIKLGMMDGLEDGLTLEDGVQIISMIEKLGIDAVELSSGFDGKKLSSVKKGVRKAEEEAYFYPFAQAARAASSMPILLVGGLRSRTIMEKMLATDDVDFVSLCRPLINDPAFPNKLQSGETDKSDCLSANNCWTEEHGIGIACKCPIDKVKAA